MAASPAFQFYPADFLSSRKVRRMSLEARGAYVSLLCDEWLEGPLDADTADLADRLGMDLADFERLWGGPLGACFEADSEGRVYCPRLERERDAQDEYRAAKAAAGKRGGRPRNGRKDVGLGTRKAEVSPVESTPKAEVSDAESTPKAEVSDAETSASRAKSPLPSPPHPTPTHPVSARERGENTHTPDSAPPSSSQPWESALDAVEHQPFLGLPNMRPAVLAYCEARAESDHGPPRGPRQVSAWLTALQSVRGERAREVLAAATLHAWKAPDPATLDRIEREHKAKLTRPGSKPTTGDEDEWLPVPTGRFG